MSQKNLKDPVSETSASDLENEDQAAMIRAMDGDDIDFHATPEKYDRPVHPFDGYPDRKVKIGEDKAGKPVMVKLSSLIMLTPGTYIHQDPSGEKVSHIDPRTKTESFIDYATFHNRIVKDSKGNNIDVVFDRTITFDNGKTFDRVAICPDHVARAQVIYTWNPKVGRGMVDRRYGVFDIKQLSRLRQVFNGYHHQQTAAERRAARFDQEPETETAKE
jgi:hypothetical protein